MPQRSKTPSPEIKALPTQWRVAVGDLLPAGAALLVGNQDRPGSTAVFVRLEIGELDSQPTHSIVLDDGSLVVAYLNVCTHMGCSLVRTESSPLHDYQPGISRPAKATLGPCPCHGTTFDLIRNGMVVFGQATTDLVQLELTLKGSELIAKLKDKNAPLHEKWPVP